MGVKVSAATKGAIENKGLGISCDTRLLSRVGQHFINRWF